LTEPSEAADLVREVKSPFSPDAVVAEFATILKRYGLTEVWSDNYGAVWPRVQRRVSMFRN
jgi:hypothetical protein